MPERKSRRRAPSPPVAPANKPSTILALARQLQALSASVLGGVGAAADVSLALAAARLRPGPKAAVEKAAALLREARQSAGMSLDELGEALEVQDPSFMALVESGKIGLPFDMILRLATLLGRNDPITFVLQLTRSYNPRVWRSLEALGVGKLVVQAGREREFANIYRSRDAARQLSDQDFAAALAFAAAAFDSALTFLGTVEASARKRRRPQAS